MAEFPHFAYPFQRGAGGKVGVVEQDTAEHVLACENVIVRCPHGFRLERPEFGIPWPEYRTTVDPGEIASALRRQEPRSNITGREVRDRLDPSIDTLSFDVEV